MSTVKRKKKTNGDTRQSEQLRNWLNKSKNTKCMPPVSFKVFSQLVENLPDIAFQIQVTGSSKPKGTLDECAEWFYNEFYKNSAIREKYEIKVRSCPLAIKNKLLQLPIAEEATTTATGTATEIGVDVAIKNGRFQFPVSFATFKQYINKQRLINDLLRKKTDQERQLALGDSKKLEDLLRKGYNIFYMFPHRRRLSKYEFKEASPEILELLLKPGVPLDEAAVKTVSESPSCKSRKNKARAIQLQESLTSIVSFDVFEKFIKNIYEIVWQLKLNDLKNEGFDNCAKAYYIAFYLTPEIRERIQYELVPCTSSMRNRLLALPSEADRAILLEMQKISLEIATSQELELNVISPPVEQLQIVDTPEVSYEVQLPYNKDAVESNAMSKDDNPVTFKLFKRYIKNLDGIVSEMLSSDEYKGKTKDECALEYFKAFYTTSQIRTKFKPELKACPSKIRAKLLALPAEEEVIVDVVDIDNNVPNEGNPPKVLTVAQDKDNVVDLPSKENLVKIKGINYTYPVDIKTFLRYVNYDELKKQLVDAHAKTKKIGDEANEKQLFKRFYYSFYLDKSLRKQFNYNFNAAPAHQRSKFTEMAVAITEKHGEELPQQVANTEPFYTTSQIRKKFKPELKACPSKISAKLLALPAEEVIIDVVDNDNDVPNEGNPPKVLSVAKDKDNVVDLPSEGNLVKIKGINYTYPVDIKTFLRYVNYDELKKQLVDAHAKTKKIGDDANEKQLFKRFYYSFYLDKSLRKKFNYNFNAAPAHQRSKFTEMAVAIPEKREELPQQVANTEPSTSTHISAQEQPILEPSNCKSNEITCSDCELDVIVDIGKSGRFQFPVSFETFKRCINYDELLHPLLLHVTQQCNEKARMIAKSDPMRCRNVFTRYYRSFYVRPIVRKQYAYRFESVSASLKSKLMQYAVPLNARARKEMNIAATIGAPKACAAVIEEGTTETEVDMAIDEIVEITEINERNVASFGNEIAIGRKKNSVVTPNEASNASGKISNTQITEEVIILNSEDTDVSLQRTPLMASTVVEKTSNASGILRNKTMIDSENTHTFAIGEKAASPRMAVAITEKREEELPQRVANTEPSTSTQICEQKQPILECSDCELDVMEEIVNLGRFIFPASFETFKRCINYDELLHPLLLHVTQQRQEEARFIAETDPKRCHNVFTQFYRSFYVRPIVRRLYAYRFESVSAELESKLMKYPVPLNETARRTMNMATVKDVATTGADVIEERTPDEVIFLSSDTDTDTDVSFQSTPLMVETSATIEKTSNAFGILTNKPMIGSENTHTFAIGEKAASTSSGKTNDDLTAENNSELNTKKMHTSSIPACEVEKVKNTPITGTDKSNIVKNTAIAGVEIVHESAIVENTATEVVTAIKDNMALSGIEKKMPHHEYEGSPSTTLPVSFKLFKKYITNLDAIVQQMLKCDDHADKTEDECAFQYFTAFYLEPAVREKYEFQIKPCPAKLREKILSIPVIEHESEHGAELQLGVEAEPETNESPAELLDINCNSQQSNDSDPLVVSQRIIITLKNMIYEFPVALQTFKQFINYESLKLELVKTYMKDKPKSNVESILNDEQINSSLLRRFYHSFYIDPRVRKCFKYNFNAAPVEFRPKLLEYAVPLVRSTRPIKTERIATIAQKENELQLAVNSTLDLNDSRENNAAFAQVSAQEQRCLSVDLETIAKRKDAEVPTSQEAAQSLNMESMPAKRACDVPKLNVSAVCSTGISPPSTQCSIMSTPETSEQCGSSAAVASPLEKESPLCSLESMAPLVQSGSSEKSKTDNHQASSDAAAGEVLQQQLESQLQSPEALSATSEIEDQSSNDSTVIYNDKADRCLADHTYNISCSSGNECESLEDIYADRSDELELLEKQNVMEYIPHNLTYYIAHRTMNLRTRALLEKEFIIDRRPKQKAKEFAANAIRSATNPQTIAKSYTTGNKTIPMVVIFPSSTAVAAPLASAAVPSRVTLRKANNQTIANIKAEAKYSTEIAEAANNSESNLVDVKEDYVDVKEDIVDVDCSTANVANQHQNTFSAPEILEKVGTTKFADRRTEKVTRKLPRSIATVVDNLTEITKDTRTNAVESNKDKVSGIVTAINAKIGSTVVATNETSSTTTTATAGTSEVVVKNESSSKSVTETVPSSTAATSKIVARNESTLKSVTETLPSSTAATKKRALLEKDIIIDRRPKQKAEELAANAIQSAANPQTIGNSYTTGNKTIPMVVIFPSSTAVAAPLASAAVPATVTLRKANNQTIANIKAEAKYSTEIAEAANNSESNLVDVKEDYVGVKEDIVDVDEDIVGVDCSTANVANQHQNTFSAPEILEKVGTKKFANRRPEKVTRKVSRSIATVVDNSTEITKDTRTNAVESNKDKVSGIVTVTNAKIGSTVVATNETSSTTTTATAGTSEVVVKNESSSKSVTETVPSSTGATSKIVAGNESSSKSVTETLPSSTAATNKVVATNVSSSKGVPKTIPSSIATTSEVVTGKVLRSKSVPEAIPRSTAAISEVADTNESSSKGVTETHASSTAATSKIVAGNDSSSKSVTETIPSSTAATSEVVAGNESSSKSVKSVTETHTSSTAGTSELVSGSKSSLKSVTGTIPSSRAATKEVVAASESSSKSVTETIPSSTAATSEVVSTNESSSKSVPKTIPSSTATSSKVEVNKASYTSATKALETVSEATKETAPQAIASTDAARETSKTAPAAVVSESSSSSQLKESNRAVAKPTEETTDAPTTLNLNSIDFFASIGKEHNLKYLIYTSHGLKQTVWCILSQLTCSEFKKYTCIHNGESFYKDESLFSRVYSHVIHEGNWPINLFVKLSMLIELLRSKDVQIDELDLAHLSPKVLHSSELMRYTNFDDIAERNYRNRTGDRVNNLVDLFSEVENFYVECWMQDQWIQQVPRVTSQELKLANAKIEPVALNIPECRIPICLLEKVPEAVIEIESETIELYDNSPQDILQESDCPATQLEQSIAGNSLFVDVEDVLPATQLPEAQSDPLMETSIEMPTVQIKQEPVKLLSNMRFTIDSSQSQEVVCESISPEEQIINLDEDDERIAAELSCFAIVPPKDRSPPLSFLNANLSKCEFDDLMKDVSLSPELQLQITNQLMSLESSQIEVATSPTEESQVPVADVPPVATATAVAAPASPVRSVTIRKPSRAFKSTLPSKRPRLMADNVPQLRHDFRPLPFTAAVPNQAAVNPSAQQELPTTSSSQVQSQSQQDSSDPPMTASQELATDNTLMASSQLQHLLDAPHVNVRQVNELPMAVDCVSDKNDRASLSMPQAVLHQQIVFSTLQRFLYFESLTTSQIAKYQINSLSVGSLHQQALISVNGQLFNVNGQLLEHLFPQLTRSLLQDLQHLLNNVGEFNYNCRLNLHQDTKEDLRLRVLYAFMRASPPFTHIRLQFENATREWATFSATNERDRDLLRRKPKCDVRASLKPEILQRMKEVKSLCYF